MTLKEKVASRRKICGIHVNLTDPVVTELISYLGYDFIWVDMEHTKLSPEHIHHHILAAKAGNTPIVVRVPVNDLTVTKKVLEMGIDGIVFPMVRDADHAKELLGHTLYPPYGTRGCGPKGAVRYDGEIEKAYYRDAHLQLCRFVQVETESAAEDAERIAALPHLDGCILGMHDLSGSIGRLGDIFCEKNLSLANKTIAAFRAAGRSIGVSTFATDRETLERYDRMGLNILSTGADYVYIQQLGRQTLALARDIQKQA